MKRALTIGSISYDKIFTIDGSVEDGIIIKDGKVDELDLTFRADEPKLEYGGTGANIAYGLGLLGARPVLTGMVGEDFHYDYLKRISDFGVEPNVYTKEGSFTATFYGIEDKNHKTISIWQPNASIYINELNLKHLIRPDFVKDISVVIVSPPGKPDAFPKLLRESRELFPEAEIIFDPGQDLSYMEKSDVETSLELTDMVITNEVEIEQLKTKIGMEIENLFSFNIKAFIETKGGDGSVIHLPELKEKVVAPCKVEDVIQVTGAGDAFRSGLIFGLLENKDLETACRYGSVMGSFAVESWGGQGYKISYNDFIKRFTQNYGK